MTLAQDLLQDFKTECDITRRHLEAVPAEKFGWKPHAKSMDLVTLAGHLAENPIWVTGMFDEDLDIDQMMKDYVAFVPKTKKELLDFFDANVKAFVAKLEKATDAHLLTEWKATMGGKVVMKGVRHTHLRSTGIHHQIHHRGQMTVYFRMLDIPVPQSYGPTADVQWDPSKP